MKKLHCLAVIALGVAMMTSCKTVEVDCIDCKAQRILKQSYVVDTVSGDEITIYPVITPRNYDFCDSFVYYQHSYIEPYKAAPYAGKLFLCSKEQAVDTAKKYREMGDVRRQTCVCRENPETIFNDDVSKNDFLYIAGIENYPYSVLHIKVPNDTTKIRTYYNYNNQDDTFNGLVLRTENTHIIESKMLKSGVYEGVLMFYKDMAQQVPLGDTITFPIAIIRTDKVVNINCLQQAKDQDDTKILK